MNDAVVDRLPDIDGTIEVGVFGALDLVNAAEPRRRLRLGASVQHDLLGEHDGLLASSSVQAWQPLSTLVEVGAAFAVTWGSDDYMAHYFSVRDEDSAASGLDVFSADAGSRDVRLTLGPIVPLGPHWLVGVGGMAQQLLGDAADSPIVAERGSATQLSGGGGLGVAYAW